MGATQLTPEERAGLTLSAQSLQSALDQVKVNGYVLFESVIPAERLAMIREAFMTRLAEQQIRAPSNRGNNRYQMHLPFREPFMDPFVIAHPLALTILDAVLGSNCHCHYFASDTALPGSDYQEVHSDIALLFPETLLSSPAYSIVVNIPLIDVTLEHGPVEIWPGGTHLMPGPMTPQNVASHMHSELVTMPAGSLLIRDMRMWHRGTPNRSNVARPHLALVYSRYWFRDAGYGPIEIPKSVYAELTPRGQQLFRFGNIVG